MVIGVQNSILAVAAICLSLALFSAIGPAAAQTPQIDALMAELKDPANADWQETESRIWEAWSHSGSQAMDLLLERGRAAIRAGDYQAAVEHLTALTDHAPDFAEGWNARATVFFLMGKYALSIHDIERTLALNPRHFGAMSGLGKIMERLDRPRDALRAYREALTVHPHRPDLKQAIERLNKVVGGTEL